MSFILQSDIQLVQETVKRLDAIYISFQNEWLRCMTAFLFNGRNRVITAAEKNIQLLSVSAIRYYICVGSLNPCFTV